MDRLQLCMEILRRLAKETDDSNRVTVAEREINDYLKNEIDALGCPATRSHGYRRGGGKESTKIGV